MQQRVPHELEEVILGNLRSDTSTLKACSLACHRFASVSQKLLFDNVVLDFSASPKRVYAPSPTSPQRFPTLLESSPHISELIHSVDIIANSYLLQSLDAILLPCLPQLVNLRSISLDTISARPIYWRYLSADMRRALRTAFHSKHIVNIRLRRVFEVPLSLLAECTTLEGLSLSSITFRQEDVSVGRWEAPLLKRRPQLKSLHLSISNEVYQGFLKWLLGRTCTLDISKLLLLSISIFSENFDYGNIDKLLQATRSLEVLCLSPFVPEYQGLYSAAELPNPLHLSSLSRLRIFRLRTVSKKVSKTLCRSFRHQVLSFVKQFNPSQPIEEISIKSSLFKELEGGLYNCDMSAWSEIDTTLNALLALRRVTLFVLQDETELHPEILMEIQSRFCLLDSKYIFQVQAASSHSGFLSNFEDCNF